MKLHVREDLVRFEKLLEHRPLWQRVSAISVACLVHGVVYFVGNHFPSSEPRLLHSTFIDEAVPFLPLTAIVYVSAYAQAIAAQAQVKIDHGDLTALLYLQGYSDEEFVR